MSQSRDGHEMTGIDMVSGHVSCRTSDAVCGAGTPRDHASQPRTSTRDDATVGVAGAVRPMNDFRRPSDLNVDTRGVDNDGNGKAFDVIVSVDGVRVAANVGDGGKTNRV